MNRIRRMWGTKSALDFSVVFDAAWYLEAYPDIVGVDPLTHYSSIGWAEGRKPHPLFDTEWYLTTYPDVEASGQNPLAHYLETGWRERRQPNPLFHTRWYLDSNPDISKADIDPLTHYIRSGADEGRHPHPVFDPEHYASVCPSFRGTGESALAHYLTTGWRVGCSPHPLLDPEWYREKASIPKTTEPLSHFLSMPSPESPHPLFDTKWYLEQNEDVARSGQNPLIHYIESGNRERRSPHPLFDPVWYLEAYPDVKASGIDPFKHFLTSGYQEGRCPSAAFDTDWYAKKYPEAAQAGLNLLDHYVRSGMRDGLPAAYAKPVSTLANCKRKFVRHNSNWDEGKEAALRAKIASSDVAVDQIKVSIVMPTRNRAACIGRAIQSVLTQSHLNWELIVVDDGSEDNTTSVVQKYVDPRVIYIKNEERCGVSAARNVGLSNASGDWIFFLDSDNSWRPDFLEIMLKFAALRELQSLYCAANVMNSDGATKSVLYADFDMESCLYANYIDLNAFGVSRRFAHMRFDETLKRLVDWDYILRIAAETPMMGCAIIGVDYYDGDDHNRISRNEHNSLESLQNLMGSLRQKATANWLQRCKAPRRGPPNRIAVVFHAYHKEFIAECLEYIKNIPITFDLYVTTSHSLADPEIQMIRDKFEHAVLLNYPNVGSDIAPFFELVSTVCSYDLVCKVHTKRDTERWGNVWRQQLIGSVLGTEELVRSILDGFASDEHILAAGGEAFFKLGEVNSIPQTREQVRELAVAVGLDHHLDEAWCFFAGTVFWARPQVFGELARHACDSPRFSSAFQRDGAIEHAWERLAGMVLLETSGSKVIVTKPLDKGRSEVRIVPTTEGTKEGITVTLDRMLKEGTESARTSKSNPRGRLKVSTVVPTYNQREFIRSALESAIMQVGDFDHEILVSDDGSTDGTLKIIEEFAYKFPNLVRSIGGPENVGISANFRNCFQQASGDFIAMLEGDDFWLHPQKLVKQVRFLEENRDCSMVFSKIEVLDEIRGTRIPLERQHRLHTDKLDGADFLSDENMNLIANFSSCCFRTDLMKQAPDVLFEERINEIAVAFYLERYGKIGFINESGTVYRMHQGGLWSGSDRRSQLESGKRARQTAKLVAKPEYHASIEAAIQSKFVLPLLMLNSEN